MLLQRNLKTNLCCNWHKKGNRSNFSYIWDQTRSRFRCYYKGSRKHNPCYNWYQQGDKSSSYYIWDQTRSKKKNHYKGNRRHSPCYNWDHERHIISSCYIWEQKKVKLNVITKEVKNIIFTTIEIKKGV